MLPSENRYMYAAPAPTNIINNLIDHLPVILASAVAIITVITGHKLGKHQSALNLITTQRIEWQETVRNELADFIKDVNDLMHFTFVSLEKKKSVDYDLLSSKVTKILAEGNRLILRLDPTEDAKVIDAIKKIMDSKYYVYDNLNVTSDRLERLVLELTTESHAMLKKEWEKIKIEAGHKKPRPVFGAFKKRP